MSPKLPQKCIIAYQFIGHFFDNGCTISSINLIVRVQSNIPNPGMTALSIEANQY